MQIIAEVKTQSPFGYQSSYSWEELFEIANRVGDIIAIHTNPRWGGSFELLEKARKKTQKPILAKGIHATDEEAQQALSCGADWVLVVGRIPTIDTSQCMIEPNTLAELSEIPLECKVVWNSRDLTTGGLKTETFQQARTQWGGWLCQASNIKKLSDIDPSADAVLIGQHLPEIAKEIEEG